MSMIFTTDHENLVIICISVYLGTGRIWTGTHSYRGRLEHCVMTSSGPVYVWVLWCSSRQQSETMTSSTVMYTYRKRLCRISFHSILKKKAPDYIYCGSSYIRGNKMLDDFFHFFLKILYIFFFVMSTFDMYYGFLSYRKPSVSLHAW